MARGEHKKGRESKKPKQDGAKVKPKSDYASRQSETIATPFKVKKST